MTRHLHVSCSLYPGRRGVEAPMCGGSWRAGVSITQLVDSAIFKMPKVLVGNVTAAATLLQHFDRQLSLVYHRQAVTPDPTVASM